MVETTENLHAPVHASDAATKEAAQKLHDSITHTNWLGFNDAPQESRVKAILAPLSQSERQSLEITYHDLYDKKGSPDTLRKDLRDKLSDTDFRQAESMLNSADGRSNDAGALRVALSQLGNHGDEANAHIQQIFSTLNSRDIATMRADYQKQFGANMDSALADADGITDSTRKAVALLIKGSDKRTTADNVELAQMALKSRDQNLLTVALRGDTEAARGARKELQSSATFSTQLDTAFFGNRVVHDYLTEGRISLATIADKSQGGFLGIGENKDNFDLALKNISERERNQFARDPAYRDKITDGLNELGDAREVCRWKDLIAVPGGSLITRMADAHDDHAKVFAAVENMGENDWNRLTDSKAGAQYRQAVIDAASTYLNDGETQRLGRLLDAKTGADNFAASQQISQPLFDVVSTGDAGKIADSVMHLGASDRESYQTNAAFKKQIDDKVNELEGPGKVLVQHLLGQVKTSAELPQLDAIDQVLYDKAKNAPPAQLLKDTQTALADPAFRERLSKEECLSEREKALRESLEDFVQSKSPPPVYGGRAGAYRAQTPALDDLLKNGRLDLNTQKHLDVPVSTLYAQLGAASADEQKDFVDDLDDDQKAIAENAIAQHGKLTLADQLRSFVVDGGSDFKTFVQPLEQAQHTPGALEELKSEYASKYNHDLSDDLADKLGGGDERRMLNLLVPSGVPAREDFYAALQDSHLSGINPDGTDLTMQRAIDQFASTLEKYQSQYKELPEDERQRLNDFFGEAQRQYKESKEAFAKFVVNAVLVGGAIVAAPFTGGVSMAGVAAIAAAGAAFRTGATWAIEGDDFNASPENILKESILGGAAAGATVIGPAAFAGLTRIGTEAAEHTAATLAANGGKELLKEGAESGLQKELQNMYLSASVRGENISRKQWEALSAKFARSNGELAKLAEVLEQTSNRELKQSAETFLLRSIDRAKAEGREAAFNGATNSAINIGYNVAVTPFDGGPNGKQLRESVLMGTVGGAVIAPIFKGAFTPFGEAAERFFGAPAQKITKHAVNDELQVATGGERMLQNLRHGDRVSFNNEPGWKVQGFDRDGNLVITHDAEKQVSVKESKNLSNGWQVDSLDMRSGHVNVVKVDAERKVIKRKEFVTGSTQLALDAAS